MLYKLIFIIYLDLFWKQVFSYSIYSNMSKKVLVQGHFCQLAVIGDDISIISSNVKLIINNICNLINHNK